jgi:hypothetical protein
VVPVQLALSLIFIVRAPDWGAMVKPGLMLTFPEVVTQLTLPTAVIAGFAALATSEYAVLPMSTNAVNPAIAIR